MLDLALIILLVAAAVAAVAQPLRPGRLEALEQAEDAERADLVSAKDAKLREIRDAELDHRTGKLERDDWRVLDRELRGQAAELLRRLDAHGPESGEAADDTDSADTAQPAGKLG